MIAEADYTGEVLEGKFRPRQILDTRPTGSGEGPVFWWRCHRPSDDWLAAKCRELEQVKDLGGNWDSYGARAVHPDSVASARAFLRDLFHHGDVPKPAISAFPSGNVSVGWDEGDSGILVECLPNGAFHYSFIHDNEPSWDDEGFADRVLVTQLIAQWFHAGY